MDGGGPDRGVAIELVNADALEIDADILVLKYAQALYGVDRQVYLRYDRHEPERDLPAPGGTYLASAPSGVAAREVLFIGTRPLQDFDYSDVRRFGRVAIEAALAERPDTRHIAVTLQGVGAGLDEAEACEAELAGMLDVVEFGRGPAALERISIVEHDARRYARLRPVVDRVLGGAQLAPGVGVDPSPERIRHVGQASSDKPHVFVAMPFDPAMDDLYYYGIQNAVRKGGYLCERADLSSFTGDVLSWVKRRISTGSLVVAELTGANPNVYLEVGYAWGANIPTVLVAHRDQKLHFDVQGQRCLLYQSIRDLEEQLTAEITGLAGGVPGP